MTIDSSDLILAIERHCNGGHTVRPSDRSQYIEKAVRDQAIEAVPIDQRRKLRDLELRLRALPAK
jgi:hypothetical protein